MLRQLIMLILLSPFLLQAQPPEQFIKHRLFETRELRINVSNEGKLAWPGIALKNNQSICVWDHGLIVIGYRDGELVGTAPLWESNYTPGPIIDHKAAIEVAPQDSSLYRTFILTEKSKSDDYDFWPAKWGAPTENGKPKRVGDITAWTIYNDAHPNVQSWAERNSERVTNTNVEIRETIWGFDRPGLLGKTLFLQWKIINKNAVSLDDVFIAHWNDIDLSPPYDKSFYSSEHRFGYIFSRDARYNHCLAAAFVQLEGPYTYMTDDMGLKYHLPVTAYWGIRDDGVPADYFGGQPESLQHLYNFVSGYRHDGSPIVNPVTGDTTSFTFTGNPVEQSGWIQDGGGGGCGGISASGPVRIAPGDSQSVVYAFVLAQADSDVTVWKELVDNVQHIRDFYIKGILPPGSEDEPIPSMFSLNANYPNPFNEQTVITYAVPVEAYISIKIYNVAGQFVDVVISNFHDPGEYSVAYTPDSFLPSGIYFYQLRALSKTITKKMTYIR